MWGNKKNLLSYRSLINKIQLIIAFFSCTLKWFMSIDHKFLHLPSIFLIKLQYFTISTELIWHLIEHKFHLLQAIQYNTQQYLNIKSWVWYSSFYIWNIYVCHLRIRRASKGKAMSYWVLKIAHNDVFCGVKLTFRQTASTFYPKLKLKSRIKIISFLSFFLLLNRLLLLLLLYDFL